MILIATIIEFLFVIAVLVFVHELGHFLFAKWCGVKVDEFAIGFGPKIFNKRKGETLYRINLFPLGGYVKIVGENPNDPIPEGLDKSRIFTYQNRFKQFLILFGGVLFNFIFAYILYIVSFMIGFTASPSDFSDYSSRFKNQRILITEVVPDSPADRAGIKVGYILEQLSSLSNQNTEDKVSNIQRAINESKGKELEFRFKEDTESESKIIRLRAKQGLIEDKYAIGIAMNEVVDLRLPMFASIKQGVIHTSFMIKETVLSLYGFFHDLIFGKADLDQVSGPVGIAKVVHMAGERGVSTFIIIIALISINLGIINLLPFPALDGGRILFVAIESIVRRQIHAKFQNIVNAFGFVLLMILMVIVSIKDIIKLFK
jgi:regulator of sigma E protease